MALGIAWWDNLFLTCKYLIASDEPPLLIEMTDLSTVPPPINPQCTFLKEDMCATYNSDPFSIILTIWTTMQLVWVTMLLTVQLLQIARGLTTYEAMVGHKPHSHAGQAAMSFVTTGDTSMTSAQITSADRGPDPAASHDHSEPGHSHAGHSHAHGGGMLEAWKRLLGVDTFMAVAVHGRGAQQNRQQVNRNPFSKGCMTNCKDFWADETPVFGSREAGVARLGGERVDYNRMYEVPAGMGYVAVNNADDEV
jgi:hypothetical protein